MVGGDLFKIETVKEYSPDYYVCIDEAKAELKENARPELKKICKGTVLGKGLAVHGAEAAQSEKAVAAWAKSVLG